MSDAEDGGKKTPQRRDTPPILRAEELFQGKREIWIEHDGKCYRLRITRRNKLILQK
jgi:hemin uptake protein HemP